MPALPRDEKELRQKKINQKQYASARSAYAHKQAAKRLKKLLAVPERREKEKAFAQEHAQDTDEQLYEWVKEQKRRLGNKMKPVNTIGYTYIVERFGHWSKVIGRANAELAAEKKALITENKTGRDVFIQDEKLDMANIKARLLPRQ